MTIEELIKLYGQVCRFPMFYKDYKNTLGVFENVVLDCFEGFWEHLVSEYGEEQAEKEDTAEAFADYVEGYLEAC